jgi:hypothetical protein
MTEPEERMIDRIQKLLDRASHPNTPEHEAASALAMADNLMVKYSIDQAIINSRKSKEEREAPERRDVHLFEPFHQLRGSLDILLEQLADLADIKFARISDGKHALVGYASDIDYLELLFISVRNQFQQKMFPKWDPEGDLGANIYHFKVAGYKWIEIWRIGAQQHATPMPFTPPPNDGGRMIRLYKKHAASIGDHRAISTQRFDAYRRSYAAGFVNMIQDRIEKMTASRRGEEHSSGSGAEIALRDRRMGVLQAFYAEFPELRPLSPEERRRQREELYARQAAERKAHEEWLASLTPKERDAYYRKEERERRANERWHAEYMRRHARDHQGYSAGTRAAAEADLSGGRNNLGGEGKAIER